MVVEDGGRVGPFRLLCTVLEYDTVPYVCFGKWRRGCYLISLAQNHGHLLKYIAGLVGTETTLHLMGGRVDVRMVLADAIYKVELFRNLRRGTYGMRHVQEFRQKDLPEPGGELYASIGQSSLQKGA